MGVETQIKLNKFKPTFYQKPACVAFEKGYKKMLLVFPRRCLSGDSHIMMADRSYKLLKDIRVGDQILAWDGREFVPDVVEDVWQTGVKESVTLSSKLGNPLISSYDHQFAYYTEQAYRGFKKISDIPDRAQLVHLGYYKKDGDYHPDLAEFIGYMQSDGYVSGYQQPKFTNTNQEILQRVEYLAHQLFGIKAIWRKKGNGYDLGLTNGTQGGGTFANPVKQLFREYNLDVPKSQRELHPLIYTFDEASILKYIAALISGDGSLFVAKKQTKLAQQRNIPLSKELVINCGRSERYAWQLYWLLRSLGVRVAVPALEKGSNYKLRIYNSASIRKLLDNQYIYGKQDKAKKLLSHCDYVVVEPYYKTISKRTPSQPIAMYDIRTRTHHNFVANGYVVHNSGKDVVAFNLTIRAALQRVGIYYYILPTAVQARRVMFEGKTSDGKRMLDFIPEELVKSINIQQMKITLVNDSHIIFVGSENYHSLRGSNPCGAVLSEAAFQHPDVYPTIRPILAANNGWVIFISTPFGENHFYKLYEVAKNNPDEWFCQMLTVNDTKHISEEQIQAEIESGEISPDMAQTEYYCSFTTGATGAYYASYLNRMELNGQIGTIMWEPSFPVVTSWDLGMRDSTVILFAQLIGTNVHIFDMYENSDVGMEHYIHVLQNKEYTYSHHIGPHDLSVREWTSGGITRKQKAAQLGVDFITAPNISIIDGIESVRTTLPRVFIDNVRCRKLIAALRNYRKEYDATRKLYLPKPYHDYNSNICDALRYLCLTLPKLRRSMTAQDIEREYLEAHNIRSDMPRFFQD